MEKGQLIETYSTNLGVTNTGTIEKYDIILTPPTAPYTI